MTGINIVGDTDPLWSRLVKYSTAKMVTNSLSLKCTRAFNHAINVLIN